MANSPPPSALVAFDFDGTLVDHENTDVRFHPGMAVYLRALKERGAVWVVNTGRSLGHTIGGFGEVGLFMQPDYIIANECEIYMPKSAGRWTDSGKWNGQCKRDHRKFYKKQRKLFEHLKGWVAENSLGEALDADDGAGFGIVAQDDRQMDMVCEYLKSFEAQDPTLGYQRNSRYLRFSHAKYHKGSALQELARQLGVGSEVTFAAGDNYNDLSMLNPQVATYRACPSNAVPIVKQTLSASGGFVATEPASRGMMQALEATFGEAWGIVPQAGGQA